MKILYLIPTPIGPSGISTVLPAGVLSTIYTIRHFFIENERTARRLLISCQHPLPIDSITFRVLDKHTPSATLEAYLQTDEENAGLLSEAGLPCVADPGAELVRLAHQRNIRIVPLSGPSSLFMALAASGLNGQNFAFNGYLPVKPAELRNRLRQLEKRALAESQAQLFIETPYRNNQLFRAIAECCQANTQLCIAADITTGSEFIKTATIGHWRLQPPELHKRPAIFILQ